MQGSAVIHAAADLYTITPGRHILIDTIEIGLACPLRVEPHADGTVTERVPFLEISDVDEVIQLRLVEMQRVLWRGEAKMTRANRFDRSPDHRPLFRDRISVEVGVTDDGEPLRFWMRRRAELLEVPLGAWSRRSRLAGRDCA